MPKIIFKNMSVYKIDKEKIAILLRYSSYKSLSLVWIGKNQKEINNYEEPLILNFNDQNSYFYSSEIKQVNNKDLKDLNDPLTNYKTKKEYQLTDIQQRELIDALDRFIDSRESYQKLFLLELKNDFLEREYNSLKEKYEESQQEVITNNHKIDSLVKENTSLEQWNNNLGNETKELHKKNDTLNNLKELFKWKIDQLTKSEEFLKAENTSLKNLIKDANVGIELFQEKVKDYEKINNDLQKDTNIAYKDFKKIENTSKKIKENSELLTKDIQLTTEKVKSLKSELNLTSKNNQLSNEKKDKEKIENSQENELEWEDFK